MTTRWLVDASNVVGSRPDGWWRDRPRALARLLDEIARWQDQAGEPVTVVADGFPTAHVPEGAAGGVQVRYAHSNRRDAADDVIAELAASDAAPSELVVVTSDAELRARVSASGARVEGGRRFLDRIADAEASPPR